MGIFSFLKKFGKKEEIEEIVIEKLAFSDIKNWVEKKIKENKLREKEVLFVIEKKIGSFVEGFREKIIILEAVDVESKKEKEEIKGIVNNSRNDYVKSVESFLESLNYLEMNVFEDSVKKINNIFLEFNKESYKNYERATILIGKEMASIKKSLRIFSKELIKIFDEEKEIADFFKRISAIESKLEAILSIDKTLEKIGETKSSLNENINRKEEENKKFLEEVEKVKQSSNYSEGLRIREEIESLKEKLKNDIFGLKQILDFKSLANFFHINEEQMKILKNHKEDFQTNFRKDDGKMIMDLLDEAKLNNKTISEKFNLIRNKMEKISDCESEIKEDGTLKLNSQIKKVVVEIDDLKIEKFKEEKREEKIEINKEELIDLLKKEFGNLNVELIN